MGDYGCEGTGVYLWRGPEIVALASSVREVMEHLWHPGFMAPSWRTWGHPDGGWGPHTAPHVLSPTAFVSESWM